MGMQLREFAAWAQNRKILATLLVTVTLAIGIVIGTVASGRVVASHPAAGTDATPLAIPDPVQLSSAFASRVAPVPFSNRLPLSLRNLSGSGPPLQVLIVVAEYIFPSCLVGPVTIVCRRCGPPNRRQIFHTSRPCRVLKWP